MISNVFDINPHLNVFDGKTSVAHGNTGIVNGHMSAVKRLNLARFVSVCILHHTIEQAQHYRTASAYRTHLSAHFLSAD